MADKCERDDCRSNNRCMAKKSKDCPNYPGAPSYPKATPKPLRTNTKTGNDGGFL